MSLPIGGDEAFTGGRGEGEFACNFRDIFEERIFF